MVASPAPTLGILAGGGHIPAQLMAACERQDRPYFVFCLMGQADTGLAEGKPHTWLHFGEVGRLKALVAEQNIQHMVMIGRVRRPTLSEIKPDWLGMKVLAKLGLSSLGDDALLKSLGKILSEETGTCMIGMQDVFADLVTPAGVLGGHAPPAHIMGDIALGVEAARRIGRADIGQSVIIQQGIVLGEEGAEGTDALILRTAPLQRSGSPAVLVKMAKPQQDDRYDLPSIGAETLRNLAVAKMAGVAVEAGRSLFVDRDESIKIADDAGMFVLGVVAHD